MKNNYGFVLIQPQLGENIGASARSLKNFGFSNLIITNPKCGWPNIKAKATSVGAFDILNKTKVFNNTETAIKNFDLIFISLISLSSGIFLALIFIQLRKIRDAKNIEYDFEEALDDDSILSSLPSGLSIENDKDQQQFDLAVTYYEMNITCDSNLHISFF